MGVGIHKGKLKEHDMDKENKMQPKLATRRLLFDLLKEDDHEFILSLLNSKGWLQYIGDRNVHSKEGSIDYIKRIKSTPDLFYWLVRLKDSKAPIGIISFLKRSYLEHFDIGFAFLPDYNGHGYAYEAAKKVLSVASKKPEYATILATTVPQNIRSIRLLEKLGLHFENEIEVQNATLHIYSNSSNRIK